MAGFLADTVEARTMPPWMPSKLSPAMRDDVSLTDEQIAIFSAFADAVDANPVPLEVGAPPLGDPADAPPPVEPEGFPLANPGVIATMSEPFTPSGIDSGEDEFRCFVVNIDVPTAKALMGFRFLPGNDLVDHHAILTLYPKADLSLAEHQSSLELYFAPDVEADSLIRSFNLPRNLNPLLRAAASPIPANAAAHTIESTTALADLVPGARAVLEYAGVDTVFATGVSAHGHLLLKHYEMIADEGGPDERVLLDIPAWDFNWQGQYVFVNDIPLDIETPITVRCTYDNTPENRARQGLEPTSVTVTAGEGTGEEMCIGLLHIVPRDPTP